MASGVRRFNLWWSFGPTTGGTVPVLKTAAAKGYSFSMIGEFEKKANELTELIRERIYAQEALFVTGTRGSGKSQMLTQVAEDLAEVGILPIIVTLGQDIGSEELTFATLDRLIGKEFAQVIQVLMGEEEVTEEFRQYLDERFEAHIHILKRDNFGKKLLDYCNSDTFSLGSEDGFYGKLAKYDERNPASKLEETFRTAVLVDDLDKRSDDAALELLKNHQQEFQELLSRPGALIVLCVRNTLFDRKHEGMDYLSTTDGSIQVPLLSNLTVDDLEELAINRLSHLQQRHGIWSFEPTQPTTLANLDMKSIVKHTGCPDLSAAKDNMVYAVMKSVASVESEGRDSVRSFYKVLNTVINHESSTNAKASKQVVDINFLEEVLGNDSTEMAEIVSDTLRIIFKSPSVSSKYGDVEEAYRILQDSQKFFRMLKDDSISRSFVIDVVLDLISRDDDRWRSTPTASTSAKKRFTTSSIPGQEFGNRAFQDNIMTRSILLSLAHYIRGSDNVLDEYLDEKQIPRDFDEVLNIFSMGRIELSLGNILQSVIAEDRESRMITPTPNRPIPSDTPPMLRKDVRNTEHELEMPMEDVVSTIPDSEAFENEEEIPEMQPYWMFRGLDQRAETPTQSQAVRNEISRRMVKQIITMQHEQDPSHPALSDTAESANLPNFGDKNVEQWIDEYLDKGGFLNGLKRWIAMHAKPEDWNSRQPIQSINMALKATEGWEANFERDADEIERIFESSSAKVRWDREVEARFNRQSIDELISTLDTLCQIHIGSEQLYYKSDSGKLQDPRDWNVLQCIVENLGSEPKYDQPILTIELVVDDEAFEHRKGTLFWAIQLMRDIDKISQNMYLTKWKDTVITAPINPAYYVHPFHVSTKHSQPIIDLTIRFPFIKTDFELTNIVELLRAIMCQSIGSVENIKPVPHAKWHDVDGKRVLRHHLGELFGKICFVRLHTESVLRRSEKEEYQRAVHLVIDGI